LNFWSKLLVDFKEEKLSFHLKLIMDMDAIPGFGTPLPDLLPLKQCPSVVSSPNST
jgi:hypothetical protein